MISKCYWSLGVTPLLREWLLRSLKRWNWPNSLMLQAPTPFGLHTALCSWFNFPKPEWRLYNMEGALDFLNSLDTIYFLLMQPISNIIVSWLVLSVYTGIQGWDGSIAFYTVWRVVGPHLIPKKLFCMSLYIDSMQWIVQMGIKVHTFR